jgi:protein ImuA
MNIRIAHAPGDSAARLGFPGFLATGFLAAGSLHELRAPPDSAAHLAFAVRLLAGLPPALPILFIGPAAGWYPPGLAWLGLDPARCLFAEAADDAQGYGALEVALRGGMAGLAEGVGLTRLAARRLALAAKDGGGIGLLLRHAPRQTSLDSTAVASRWFLSPAPGGMLRAERLYAKAGPPAVFVFAMEDENDAAPPAVPVVASESTAGQRSAGQRSAGQRRAG